jgi:hypothetical protein
VLRPEHAAASPFRWARALLAPCAVLWDYLEEWHDTDAGATMSVCFQLLVAQLLHWALLWGAARDALAGRLHSALQAVFLFYVVVPAAVTLLAFGLYLTSPLLPDAVCDAILYGVLAVGPVAAVLPLLLSDRPETAARMTVKNH